MDIIKIFKAIIVCGLIVSIFGLGHLFGQQDCNCSLIEFKQESMQDQDCFLEWKKAYQDQVIQEVQTIRLNATHYN